MGELVAACVVLRPNTQLTEEGLIKHCRQRLANYKVPRHVEFSETAFPGRVFNILNHPNFGNPTNSLPSPLFGRSTQTLANSLGPAGRMADSILSTRSADHARSNWR